MSKIQSLVLCMLFVGFGWVLVNYHSLVNFQHSPSRFFSKQFCSCMFVLKKDEAFCRSWSQVVVPVSDYTVNVEEKWVDASALWATNRSVYQSRKLGCVARSEHQ